MNVPSGVLGRMTYKKLVESLFVAPVVAYRKLDGTNVSKSDEGVMFGRRTVITGLSYQKVGLVQMQNYDVATLKETLPLRDFGASIGRLIAFGELMCNPGLYDYTQAELAGKWLLFGAMLEISVVEHTESVNETLRLAGFATVVRQSDEPQGASCIQILPCEAWMEAVRGLGWACVPFHTRGTIGEIVASSEEWMVQGMGEGLILTTTTGAYKWKIGAERQPNNVTGIFNLLRLLNSCDGTTGEDLDAEERTQVAALKLLPPEFKAMVERMYAVSVSRLQYGRDMAEVERERERAKGAKKKSKEAEAGAKTPLDASVVDEAIRSARTKFDTLESYFERLGVKAGRAAVVADLMGECSADLGLTSAGAQAAELRQVGAAINKKVGQAVGMWTKMQKEG